MMTKKSKLTEKSTRIPETRVSHWDTAIEKYFKEVKPLYSEPARSHRFSMLLQEILNLEPDFIEHYSAGIEQYLKVKQKDRLLKGRADNLFGNVIIEFESSLPKKLAEAEDQLKKYSAILWSQEKIETRTPYICLATDGVNFITYSPLLKETVKEDIQPQDIELEIIEEIDWQKLKSNEIFYWLDRYFLRQEILHPNSETIVNDFGLKSHAFTYLSEKLIQKWNQLKQHNEFSIVYQSWEKYLLIVYGSKVTGEALFIRHTYLATLAKLMSWIRLTEITEIPGDTEILEMLEGKFFKEQGIDNYIEEDFFSWIARRDAQKTGIDMVHWLYSLLRNYNLRELSEDVLKSLYQELVDPETRHDLGEFYTPDWLAHKMVNRLLDDKEKGSIYDPACGSGTFLYLAIREKRRRLGNSFNTLLHILDHIYGSDIHPLAVIIAKTNYILALGDLLQKRKGSVTIPVYLADTIKLPEKVMQGPQYYIEIDSKHLLLEEDLLQNLQFYDWAIELAKDFAFQNKGKPVEKHSFYQYLKAQHFPFLDNDHVFKSLFEISGVLKEFIEENRDSIWAYVLKNIYKPLFFKDKFDFIIGNPPWIAYRNMDRRYQVFMKDQVINKYRLLKARGELITHLEIAALFLLRTADLYLKPSGKIAFVLPRSIFSADQHDGLRRKNFQLSENEDYTLKWQEVWDCEHVAPLFNVPACVMFASKDRLRSSDNRLRGNIFQGRLSRKNASLAEAIDSLQINNTELKLHTYEQRSFWSSGEESVLRGSSYYKKHFYQGATIVPRSFWFVQVKSSPLGFNPDLPPLETSDYARQMAKDAYKDVYISGNVESKFLFITLFSTDIIPFGNLNYRISILPIENVGNGYKILNFEVARNNGYFYLAQWLEKAEKLWKEIRGEKYKNMSIYERLDRVKGITRQNPNRNYKVIYNTSGTFLTSSIVENRKIIFKIDKQEIIISKYISDYKTYFYELDDKNESFYITSVLNSPLLNRMIKPLQSRGLWGPRDICKKVFEFPIPKFDPINQNHKLLAELGHDCTNKVKDWLKNEGPGKIKSIGKIRGMVREILKEELKNIDLIVESLFKII